MDSEKEVFFGGVTRRKCVGGFALDREKLLAPFMFPDTSEFWLHCSGCDAYLEFPASHTRIVLKNELSPEEMRGKYIECTHCRCCSDEYEGAVSGQI